MKLKKNREEAEVKLREKQKVALSKNHNPNISKANKKEPKKMFLNKIIFYNRNQKGKRNFIMTVFQIKQRKKNARNCHVLIKIHLETY